MASVNINDYRRKNKKQEEENKKASNGSQQQAAKPAAKGGSVNIDEYRRNREKTESGSGQAAASPASNARVSADAAETAAQPRLTSKSKAQADNYIASNSQMENFYGTDETVKAYIDADIQNNKNLDAAAKMYVQNYYANLPTVQPVVQPLNSSLQTAEQKKAHSDKVEEQKVQRARQQAYRQNAYNELDPSQSQWNSVQYSPEESPRNKSIAEDIGTHGNWQFNPRGTGETVAAPTSKMSALDYYNISGRDYSAYTDEELDDARAAALNRVNGGDSNDASLSAATYELSRIDEEKRRRDPNLIAYNNMTDEERALFNTYAISRENNDIGTLNVADPLMGFDPVVGHRSRENQQLENYARDRLSQAGYTDEQIANWSQDVRYQDINRRVQERTQDFVNDHSPAVASLASVAVNQLTPTQNIDNVINYINRRTGNKQGDVTSGYIYTTWVDNVRQEVANSIDSGLGRFAYQTGMSMADMAATMVVSAMLTGGTSSITGFADLQATLNAAEPVVLTLMSGQAASRSYNDVIARGGTDTQALITSVVSGAIEAGTEKIGLDALCSSILSGAIKETGKQVTRKELLKDTGKYVLENVLSEGGEEALSDVFNLFADIIINGDRAQAQMDFDNYKAQGMAPDEALGMVVADQLKQIGADFAGGALSGLGFAAPGAGVNLAYIGATTAGEHIDNRFRGDNMSVQDTAERIDQARAIAEQTNDETAEQAVQQAEKVEKQEAEKKKGAKSVDRGKLEARVETAIDKQTEGTAFEGVQSQRELNARYKTFQKAYNNGEGQTTFTVRDQEFNINQIGQQWERLTGFFGGVETRVNELQQARGVTETESKANDTNFKFKGLTDAMTKNMAKLYDGTQSAKDFQDSYLKAAALGRVMGKQTATEMFNQYVEEGLLEGISQEAFDQALADGFAAKEFRHGVTNLVGGELNRNIYSRATVRVLDAIGKKFGLSIVLTDGLKAENGAKVDGAQIAGTNLIVIDANSEGSLLRVAGHEIYHFIDSFNSEAAALLKNTVFEGLRAQGVDIDALRGQYGDVELYDNAEKIDAEIVADSMFDVFDEKTVRQLVTEMGDKTARKFARHIGQFVDTLRREISQYTDRHGDTREIAKLRNDVQRLEKIRDLFYKALEGAKENFAKGEQEGTKTEFSQTREISEEEYLTNPKYALTMEQARAMLQRAYNAFDIRGWGYNTIEEWLEGDGIDGVANYLENEASIYDKYIASHDGWVEGEITTEEVLQAYLDGELEGRPKETAKRLDTSKDTGIKDNRFYSPKVIKDAKAQFNIATQKVTNANRDEVTKARAAILFFAHEKGAAEALGLTETELNKRLRQWSNYSARAKDASTRINEGAAVSNRWTGIENLSILSRQTVTADDIKSMVKSVEGNPSDYETQYIGRTMLSLDTHIDWSWLNFKFDTIRGVNQAQNGGTKSTVRGYFSDKQSLIHVVSDGETVAHEMGHALDSQWGREVTGGSRTLYLTELSVNDETIATPKVRQWVKNFKLFMQDITDSADIRSQYTQEATETFARFVAKFVEWNEVISTGRRVFLGYNDFNDKFTTAQYIEFARLLQEKAALSIPTVQRKDSAKFSQARSTLDQEYMDALEKYGEDSPQVAKLVMQAAEQAGYNIKAYHGTSTQFTKFIKDTFGKNYGGWSELGGGFYFTPNEKAANQWAETAASKSGGAAKTMGVYLSAKNMLGINDSLKGNAKAVEILKSDKGLDNIDNFEDDYWRNWILDRASRFIEYLQGHSYTPQQISDLLASMGYDGINDASRSGGQYVVFNPEQIKSADPVTYDDEGNVIPLSERFNSGNDDIRYSTKRVPAVQPSSDEWQRTLTFSEVKSRFPNLWDVQADESEKRNPTQISSTVKTYNKIYDRLRDEGFSGTILDASSGLGYGTRSGRENYGFDVDDIEPFPDKTYSPVYKDYSALEDSGRQYDVIISNAVLNVIPQDERDNLVVAMGHLLAPGGRMFINTRGDDVNSLGKAKNSASVNINPKLMEWYVGNTGSYQKGFTANELKAYLQDALGSDYTVEKAGWFGKASVIVTKDANAASYSATRESSEAAESFNDLYTFKDGKLYPNNLDDLSTEDWSIIRKAVNKLGYGIASAKQAKEVYSRYVGKNGFNPEQSAAIAKEYGVTEGDTATKENRARMMKAEKHYGTTTDFAEAGYLLRDGKMLDFSGHKFGGPRHHRTMDHREISEVFDTSDSEPYDSNSRYMNAFISEGQVRLMDGSGITIGELEPTAKQYALLEKFIERTLDSDDYFAVDIVNERGYDIESREYDSSDSPSKIISDLRYYYKAGELPYRSELSQFRYSRARNDTIPGQITFEDIFNQPQEQEPSTENERFVYQLKKLGLEWKRGINQKLVDNRAALTEIFDNYPEMLFPFRFAEGDKTAKADLKEFVNGLTTEDDVLLMDRIIGDQTVYMLNQVYHKANDALANELKSYGLTTWDVRKSMSRVTAYFTRRVTAINNERAARGETAGRDVGLKSGRVYHTQEIQELFNQLNTNKELRALADKVFDVCKTFGVRYAADSNYTEETGGVAAGLKVRYNLNYFKDVDVSDQDKANTLLHEAIHTATVYYLQAQVRSLHNYNAKGGYYEMEPRGAAVIFHAEDEDNPPEKFVLVSDKFGLSNQTVEISKDVAVAIGTLQRIYDDILNDPDFGNWSAGTPNSEYGTKNVKEFVAELSNPQFREKLKKKKLWDKIVDLLKKLFGIKTDTAYEPAARALDTLLDNWNVSLAKKYNEYVRGTTFDGNKSWQFSHTRTQEWTKTAEKMRTLREQNKEYQAVIASQQKLINRVQEMMGAQGKTIDPDRRVLQGKALDRFTARLIKETDTTIPRDELKARLVHIFDYAAGNDVDTEFGGFSETELNEAVFDLAMDLVNSSSVNAATQLANDGDYTYQELLDRFKMARGKTVKVSEDMYREIASGIGDFGTWAAFKKTFPGINFAVKTKDSHAIDWWTFWTDITNGFEPVIENLAYGDIYNEKNQPAVLKAVYEALTAPINPYEATENDQGYTKQDAAYDLVDRIYESFFDLPELTKMDKVRRGNEETYEELRMQYKDAVEKARAEERAIAAQTLAEYKAQAQDTIANQKLSNQQLSEWLKQERKNNSELKHNEKALKEAIEKSKRVIERQNALKAQKVDTLNRGQMRKQIQKKVKKLNDMLVNATDQRHVPEKFRSAATEFVKLFMNNTSVFSNKQLAALKVAYDRMAETEQRMGNPGYDEEISQTIEELANTLNGRRLAQLNAQETKAVRDIVNNFYHVLSVENKMFVLNKSAGYKEAGAEIYNDYIARKRSKVFGGENKLASMFILGELKPDYFFSLLGNDTLYQLYKNTRKGQDKWARLILDTKDVIADKQKAHNFSKWHLKEYTLKVGPRELKLTCEQALSLYATFRRRQGVQHLLTGGITLDDKAHRGETYRPSLTELEELFEQFTDEQVAYVEDMVGYLSTTMADLGNEISMAMYGYKKFNEPWYFPLSSDKNTIYFSEGTTGDKKIKNAGMTKSTNPNANNAVTIGDFTKIFASHCKQMADYNSFVLPLEDMRRIYNYKTEDGHALKSQLDRVFGSGAKKYIEQFMTDVNGGSRRESGKSPSDILLSRSKKASVYINASVAVQQPSAVARAFAYINPWYFAKTTFRNLRTQKLDGHLVNKSYEECMRYAPVAIVKDMGLFDTSVGRNTVDWMLDNSTETKLKQVLSTSEDFLSMAPNLMDKITWAHIWEACKAEQKAKNKLKGEELLKAAGERFSDVIDKTQVYDSIFSRSQWMRSTNAFLKLSTAFMAEPTTSVNMLYNALIQSAKGGAKGKAFAARATASFAVATIFNSLLRALVTAGRDDDDKKTWLEKYIGETVGNALTDPMTLIPYVNDIVNFVQGYDAKRLDTQLIANFVDAMLMLSKDNKTWLDKTLAIAKAACDLAGVPLKNVLRDVEGAKTTYSDIMRAVNGERTTKTGMLQSIFEQFRINGKTPFAMSEEERIYNDINNGDKEDYERLKAWYERNGKDFINKEKGAVQLDEITSQAVAAISRGDVAAYYAAIEQLTDKGYDEAAVTKAIGYLYKKENGKQLSDATLTKAALDAGNDEALERLYDVRYNGYINDGKTPAEAEEKANQYFEDKAREMYKNGELNEEEVAQYLREYGDMDEDTLYWAIKKITSGGESGYKYEDMYNAIDGGSNADIDNSVREYVDHGGSASSVQSAIRKKYKDEYIRLYSTDRSAASNLKAKLVRALVASGYETKTRSGAEAAGHYIDGWVK